MPAPVLPTATRLLLAVASLAGIATQWVVAVRTDMSFVNFWSYFTNLSNLAGSVVLLALVVAALRGTEPGERLVLARGAVVIYLAFVGLVFNTLLRDADLGDLKPWVNVVHHMAMPAYVLLDWVLWPPRRRFSARVTALAAVFPAVYAVYCLVRGAVTGFYPYPFFDPEAAGGGGAVAVACAGMLVSFVALAFAVRWLGARGAPADG